MASKKEKITSSALASLETEPNGIRYSDLVRRMHDEFADIPVNTVHGTVWNLDIRFPKLVYKPARGLFRHTKFREKATVEKEDAQPLVVHQAKEEDFYKPFADWLVSELEECTKAIALGGNKFKDKWGTPDVIGIREPLKSDIIKPQTEIVSAEIKMDTGGLITAFGQACSYQLFSHKTYIVIPRDSSEEDVARLDALCRIFGIGLILFDAGNIETPDFGIRVRATRYEPDMFYANKYIKLVEHDLF